MQDQAPPAFAPALLDEARPAPSSDHLARLAHLCGKQRDLDKKIERLEAELKEAKADLKKVAEGEIPELFDELGVTELKLADGTKVKVEDTVHVSTTGENREKINVWLDKNGHGDLIKDTVAVQFGKGDTEEAGKLFNEMLSRRLHADRVRLVNAMSYAALMRELRKSGGPAAAPWEEIGAYWRRAAKLD